jgi:hypothetical protein
VKLLLIFIKCAVVNLEFINIFKYLKIFSKYI